MKKRIASILMALTLCLTLLPTTAYAAEDGSASVGTGGLCEHHTVHDETCGYTEGTEEVPCTHEHGAECYTETISCTHDTESEHVCSEESGCIVQELQCPHTHDEECGYAPATEAAPCTYVCDLCSLTEITAWSLVDALEVLDPASGILALSADAENPVYYDEIVDMLPTEIIATTEDGTETVALDDWTCDGYPEEGAYTGSYVFAAALPEGYTLAENAESITVMVEFGGVVLLADGDHEHPICGAGCTDANNHADIIFDKALTADGSGKLLIDGVAANKVTDETGENGSYILPAGNYYLNADLVLDYSIKVEAGNVNLCLNGKRISCNDARSLRVEGGTVSVTDCKDTGTVTCDATQVGAAPVTVSTEACFNLYGGSLTGGHSMYYGGAVCMSSNACFNMYGGKIYGNHDISYGGAVYVEKKATFNMYGGEIYENHDITHGGAVYVEATATFNMSGGKIYGNKTTSEGECNGGAVYVENTATFNMSGGKIYGNYAQAGGGGVYNRGIFYMSGGEIIGNSVESSRFGAGVYNHNDGNEGGSLNGKIRISGNAVIRDNYKGGTKNEETGMYEGGVSSDLFLHNNYSENTVKPVEIIGEIGENACIYIHLFYRTLSLTGDGIVVSNQCDKQNVEGKFFSDDDAYEVYYNESNSTLMIRESTTPAHTHQWSTEWNHNSGYHWHDCEKAFCPVTIFSEKDGYGAHTGGTATCRDLAVCSICNYTYGELDADNHVGGTDVRGRIEPTTGTEGYTGDTYCKGCNAILATGTVIPKLDNSSGGGGNSGGSNSGSGNSDSGNSGSGNSSNTGSSNDGSTDSNTTSAPGMIPAAGNDGSMEETPESPAAEVPAYAIYTVQKGDNLWAIAKKYGCTVAEIVAANSDLIKNQNLIYAGWQLRIPQAETPGVDNTIGTDSTPGTENTTDTVLSDNTKIGIYVVERGDNLWAISRKCGCALNEIIALNGDLITNPNLIYAGWELKIPQN